MKEVLLAVTLLQQEIPLAKPPIVRRLAAGKTIAYQVLVTTIGDAIAHYSYKMTVRTLRKDERAPDKQLQFILTEMVSEAGEKTLKRDTAGSITVTAQDAGFLEGMSFGGNAMAFSMPLLSFWLPSSLQEAGKWLPLESPKYDGRLSFVGSSRVLKRELTLDGLFRLESESPDQSRLRKLRVSTLVSDDGFVQSSTGRYTAPDGTINYSLRRL